MSNLTNAMLDIVKMIGKDFAIMGGDSASFFGFHQPKEPANLKEMLEK